ncbi:hypothetical protein, partial [Mesobacillus subterraneus]|uniref:hypothetical protein n=2 Tax=Mesobacillus TaxID=2675231 RepID=UPI0019D6F216
TLVCLVFKEQFCVRRSEATLIIYHAAVISSTSFFTSYQLLFNSNFYIITTSAFLVNRFFSKK